MQTGSQRSPTTALLFGLIITLAAVVAYSFYITVQLAGLRAVSLVPCVIPQLEKFFEVSVPGFEIYATSSLALATLIHSNNR